MNNPELIAHRVNTVKELRRLAPGIGVELDLRDHGEELILAHDPFIEGEKFDDFLKEYDDRGTLILNIKSERIEYRVLELIQKYSVSKYFFLDSSFPMINKLTEMGENNIALRYSEYEGLDTLRSMAGKIKWVWVDCFTRLPLTKEIETTIHDLGYKLCLVSPELQGRPDDIIQYRNFLEENMIELDAICSKVQYQEIWRQ